MPLVPHAYAAIAVQRLMQLPLPGFTFGVDLMILVGHLRLCQHKTLDEAHQKLLERLAPFALTISRREVLYLFDAYCTLLQIASAAREDSEWLTQVEANGGLIISIDGIQPDKGNETIYLVRDVLTGRVLTAENVSSSGKEVMKRVLAPVVALGVPVLGAISDAQESLEQAIAELWPNIPHQLCQFHVLREASRPIYEQDRTRDRLRCANPSRSACARCANNWSNSDRRPRGQRQNNWRCWPIMPLGSKRRSIWRASNLSSMLASLSMTA